MKKSQKPQPQPLSKEQSPLIELSNGQLELVQGGLNPQPLPPRIALVPSIPIPPPEGQFFR